MLCYQKMSPRVTLIKESSRWKTWGSHSYFAISCFGHRALHHWLSKGTVSTQRDKAKCTKICIYVCMYVCMYVRIHTHTHTHTHTHLWIWTETKNRTYKYSKINKCSGVGQILCNAFVAVRLHHVVSSPSAYVTNITLGLWFSGHARFCTRHACRLIVTRRWWDPLISFQKVHSAWGDRVEALLLFFVLRVNKYLHARPDA